jgi:hypothetical protein
MKQLIIITMIFCCAFAKAQQNHVLNPSFEVNTGCPSTYDQIALATYWNGINEAGQGIHCVPEYRHICGTGMATVPFDGFFYQYPRSGEGFALIIGYYNDEPVTGSRNYLMGTLDSVLETGQAYCVSFYVNIGDASGYGIDRIGAYFDNGNISLVDSCDLPQTQFTPQVENASGNVLIDTFNWVKIEGTFTAMGTEKYITLGNFYDIYNTDSIRLDFSNPTTYILIDDVSVIETDLNAYAGPDVWMVSGDSIYIGRPKEVGLECKWYLNGNLVDSGGGIWAKPAASSTYVVEQTLCGLVKTDTVHVQVVPASVNGISNSRQLSVYPNPASNVLHVRQERMIFSAAVIVNSIGQQMSFHTLTEKETSVDISVLAPGVYYLQLIGDKGREVRSFVKAPSAP